MKRNYSIWNRMVPTIICMFASLALASNYALAKGAKAAQPTDNALIVNFDDLPGSIDINAEWAREYLLETAFYDASRRSDFSRNYKVEYNGIIPKTPKNLLNIRVVDWRRTRGNLYEFRAFATYYDASGKMRKLGHISGTRSGISVFNLYDVGDHFAEAAEDAIQIALDRLTEKRA